MRQDGQRRQQHTERGNQENMTSVPHNFSTSSLETLNAQDSDHLTRSCQEKQAAHRSSQRANNEVVCRWERTEATAVKTQESPVGLRENSRIYAAPRSTTRAMSRSGSTPASIRRSPHVCP